MILWGIKAQFETAEKGTFEIVERGTKLFSSKPMNEEQRAYLTVAFLPTLILQRKFSEALQAAERLSDEVAAKDP